MKGYIYTMFAGADPGHGWTLTDPIFCEVPTLGACVPHIRRAVKEGDYIFAISGRVPGVRQFVVGGFKVAEKIDALAALDRFPEHKLHRAVDGSLRGNIIVEPDGTQSPLDYHPNFESRINNYIVGEDPLCLETEKQYDAARAETLKLLGELFGRTGDRVFDIIGRYRRLDERQTERLTEWIKDLRG